MHLTKNKTITVLLLLSLIILRASAQTLALRTNLLYDATLSPNLGAEVRLDSSWAAGINVGLNAWDIDKQKNKKWRHLLVAPNVRYYFGQKRDTLNHYRFEGDRLVDVRHDSVSTATTMSEALPSPLVCTSLYVTVACRVTCWRLVRNTVMPGFWHATGVWRLRLAWLSAMLGSRNTIATTAVPIMARATASSSCRS